MSFSDQLRHGFRMLRSNKGFSAVAIATMALGIGATTAMFAVLNGIVLKPLRYPDVDRLVAVNTKFTDNARSIWRTSSADLEDLRADTSSFERLTFYQYWEMGVQVAKRAEFVQAAFVDPNFFRVFAISPLTGRLFTPDDADRSALVSLSFAQRNYGSAAAAVGQTVGIAGRPYEITGVVPPTFNFPDNGELWAAVSPIPENRGNRNSYNYHVVAKLQPQVSVDIANAHLQALATRLSGAFPRDNANKTFTVTLLQQQLSLPVQSTLLILMGAVTLVLLIACANVANLLLVRGTARARELALRTALGASRGELIAQLLAESAALALFAAVLGLLLSMVVTKTLLSLGSQFLPMALLANISIDWRVLAFAFATALLTSCLFGIVPALQATRMNLQNNLNQGGTRGLLGGGSSRLRTSLVIAQVAVSLVLTVGAGLLFRTLLALGQADLGFRTDGILVAYAAVPAHTPEGQQAAARFFDRLIDRLRQLPGVSAASQAYGLPTGEYGSNGYLAIDAPQSFSAILNTSDFRKLPRADFSAAGPGYFSTMGMRFLQGRDFSNGDTSDRPLVAIISESLARQAFPNENPLGHRIGCGFDRVSMTGMTIIGVVNDVRQDSPASQPGPAVYVPLNQHPERADQVELVIRTSKNPGTLVPMVQRLILDMDPQVATKFTTMTDLVKDSMRAQRFRSALSSSFASLALLVSIFGMYAVMSYVTTRRTSEFALRLAIGAKRSDIIALVLGHAARMVLVGVIAGLLLSLTVGKLVQSMLYGLKSTDAITYAAVVALISSTILFAAALPAWRSSKVDPMVTLRNE